MGAAASRIVIRLAQIAYQHEQSSKPEEPLPFLRAYKPRATAIEAIPNLKAIWRARTIEQLHSKDWTARTFKRD